MGAKQEPGTRDLKNWSNGQLRGMHARPNGKYTVYHRGQEGQLSLTYQEVCKLSEMIEKMILESK